MLVGLVSFSWFAALPLLAWRYGFNHSWSYFSYYWLDLPGLPKYLRPQESVLAGHYFGDFVQILQMNRQPSPYEILEGYSPSQYPPLAHAIVLPLTFLSLRSAVAIYFVGVGLLFFAAWRIKNRTDQLSGWAMVVLLVSLPACSAIDRGNLLLIALPLLIIAYEFRRRGDGGVIITLCLALSIKPYLWPFALALMPKEHRIRWLMQMATLIISMNLISVLLFTGSPAANLRNFLRALQVNQLMGSSRFDHSYIAVLPGIVKLVIIVLGAIVTTYYMWLPSDVTLNWRVAVAAFSIVAFSPHVPAYQMVFLLIPLLLFTNDETVELRDWLTICAVLAIITIPKQVELGHQVNLGIVVDQPLATILWLIGISRLRRSSEQGVSA